MKIAIFLQRIRAYHCELFRLLVRGDLFGKKKKKSPLHTRALRNYAPVVAEPNMKP